MERTVRLGASEYYEHWGNKEGEARRTCRGHEKFIKLIVEECEGIQSRGTHAHR
jgi:hypothetical protein